MPAGGQRRATIQRAGRILLIWLLALALAWGLAQGAWPLVWRLVVLPRENPARPGLEISLFPQDGLRGQPQSGPPSPQASLELERPHSSLRARGVWRVAQPGLYTLRLTCDDYGSLRLDRQRVISLRGMSDHNQGQVQLELAAGAHFLELELHNLQGRGWLKAEILEPGAATQRLLGGAELATLDLGNLDTWLKVAAWLEVVPWWGLGLAWAGWLLHLFMAWLERMPAPRRAGSPRPLLSLGWVLAGLGALAGLLLAADLYLHGQYDSQGLYYNRRGYRGQLIPPKSPGELRVAVFGGSGAYGYGQPMADSLPAALQRELAALLPCPLTVLNLAANEQGIYGIRHDVALYEDMGYDLALLYMGATDSLPANPHWANLRGGNRLFVWTGYLSVLPSFLDEKRAGLLGDLAGLAQAAAGGDGGAAAAPVRFVLRQAVEQAGQLLRRMQATVAASEEEARRLRAQGKTHPHSFFLEQTRLTLEWLLARHKRVVLVGEPVMSGTLQQDLLRQMLARDYAGRVLYLDGGELLPLTFEQAFTDGVHFTRAGATALSQALAPRLARELNCPAAPAGR